MVTETPFSARINDRLDRFWLQVSLIVGIGLLAYANSFGVPFYFDDLPCIVTNPVVHDPANLTQLGDYWQLGITEDIRNSVVTRLVTYLSFAANYRLHGLTVGGYHLVNLLIHLGNALLVYQLVRLLRAAQAPATLRSPGQGDGLALMVALLFVAHPLQTNAVTYIVQRFASLATLFCLSTLIAYLLSCRVATVRRRRLLYGSALLATLLAMFTKEIAFTLPLLLTLCDLAFLPGAWQQRLRRLAPFLATMLLLPLTVLTLASLSEVTGRSAANALDLANIGRGSRWSYFFTQWQVIVTYLRLLLMPTGLHLEYDFPFAPSPWEPTVLVSGLFLAALCGSGLWLLFRQRRTGPGLEGRLIGFGLSWFFLTLAMESSIIPLDDLLFEYRLYLPSIGFCLAATAGLDLVRRHLAGRWQVISPIATAGAALLVLTLTGTTLQRNRIWQDELSFWQDNVAKSPNRARSRGSLADAYLQRGDIGKAVSELEIAARLNPGYWPTFETLGDIQWNRGLYRLAASNYTEALRLGNTSRALRLKLGRAQRWSSNLLASRETFATLLADDPSDSEARAELNALPR